MKEKNFNKSKDYQKLKEALKKYGYKYKKIEIVEIEITPYDKTNDIYKRDIEQYCKDTHTEREFLIEVKDLNFSMEYNQNLINEFKKYLDNIKDLTSFNDLRYKKYKAVEKNIDNIIEIFDIDEILEKILKNPSYKDFGINERNKRDIELYFKYKEELKEKDSFRKIIKGIKLSQENKIFLIKNIENLYKIQESNSEIIRLEGFNESQARTIANLLKIDVTAFIDAKSKKKTYCLKSSFRNKGNEYLIERFKVILKESQKLEKKTN